MKILSSLVIVLFIFTLSFLNADNLIDNNGIQKRIKTYISSEDLIFCDEAIFLSQDDSIIEIKALFSDSKGLYFYFLPEKDKISNTCPNGHKIYHWACGGCACLVPPCPFRCKCHSPWSHVK